MKKKLNSVDRNTELPPREVALKKIKEMMYHHSLVPGQKLASRDFAKKLNMSITPVIQALNQLESLNIVQSVRNSGFSVGETDPTEARDLFQAREALEVYLVPLIVEKITDVKLDSIEKAMKEHVKASSNHEYRRFLMMRDTMFHLRIIECAESKVFYNICEKILEQIYLKYRPEYMIESRLKESAKEHQMLLEAIRKRDAKKAKRLLRQHIRNGSKHIVGGLWKDMNTGS